MKSQEKSVPIRGGGQEANPDAGIPEGGGRFEDSCLEGCIF